MPIRSRLLELEKQAQDPVLVAPVLSLWEKLDTQDGCCAFCRHPVPESAFPWRFKHHNVYGLPHANGAATVCMGSRSVYTLKLLGLDAVL
jgi:hypothetical protein